MEFGLCTVTFEDFEWRKFMGVMEESGIRAVEIWDSPEQLPREQAGLLLLRRLLKAGEVGTVSVHGPFGPEVDGSSLDGAARERAIRENLEALERTSSVGGEFMVYHLSYRVEDEGERPERKKRAAESLSRVVEGAKRLGVKLAVENLPRADVGWSEAEIEEVSGPFWGDSVGVCLDTGHMQVCGLGLGVLDSLGSRIISLHIHDNDGTEDQHLFPGEGSFDWAGLGRRLTEMGFNGPLMLECDVPRGGDVIARMRSLMKV